MLSLCPPPGRVESDLENGSSELAKEDDPEGRMPSQPYGRAPGVIFLGVPASIQPLVDGVVSAGLFVFFVVLLVRVSRKKQDPPGDELKSKDLR